MPSIKRPEIGVVSEGTLRNQDLIPEFLDVLRKHDGRQQIAETQHGSPIPEEAQEDEDHEWWDSEEASELVQELTDSLDEIAPPFCYFGSLGGDGACFGFWPDSEILEWPPENVAIISDKGGTHYEGERIPEEWDVEKLARQDGFDFLLHINDHGNMMLLEWDATKGEYEEVWSIV